MTTSAIPMRTSRSLSIVFCLAFCTAFALRAEEEREEAVFEEDDLPPAAVFLPFDVLFPDEEALPVPAEPVPEVLFLFFAPDADEVPDLARDVPLFVFCAIDILCVCPSQNVLECQTCAGPVSGSCLIKYQTVSACARLSHQMPDCLSMCRAVAPNVRLPLHESDCLIKCQNHRPRRFRCQNDPFPGAGPSRPSDQTPS